MYEWQGGEAVGAQHAASVVDWHGHIKPEEREGLLQTWQGLKATVEALPPVGQYTVASVAYRRSVGHFCPVKAYKAWHGCRISHPLYSRSPVQANITWPLHFLLYAQLFSCLLQMSIAS